MTLLKEKICASGLHFPMLCVQDIRHRMQYSFAAHSEPKKLRKTHIIGLGNFKTGTVSLVEVLKPHLKAAHEPHAFTFAKRFLTFAKNQRCESRWKDFLCRRDKALQLEFEASGFLTLEAGRLANLFPKAKFILTVREPLSWVRSLMRHILLNRQRLGCYYWDTVFEVYFGSEAFPKEEASLQGQSLYPLKGLLKYWVESNTHVLDSIPAKRLLVLRTEKLSDSLSELEEFIGLEKGSLDVSLSHAHHSKDSFDPLTDVNLGYLKEMTRKITQPLESRIWD